MKIVNQKTLAADRVVKFHAGESKRIILFKDKMGFGLTRTLILPSEGKHFQHYKNHSEACYCVSGYGILTDMDGNEYGISPGITYILDKNDPHYFEALEETVLICVWNPPLIGEEVHRKDGSYSTDGSNEDV